MTDITIQAGDDTPPDLIENQAEGATQIAEAAQAQAESTLETALDIAQEIDASRKMAEAVAAILGDSMAEIVSRLVEIQSALVALESAVTALQAVELAEDMDDGPDEVIEAASGAAVDIAESAAQVAETAVEVTAEEPAPRNKARRRFI